MTPLRDFVDNLRKIFIEFFYPRRCVGCGKLGGWFCPACLSELVYLEHQFCPKCGKCTMQGFTHTHCLTEYSPDRVLSAFPYKDPIREAIKQMKYKTEVLALVAVLGDLIEDYLEKYQIYIPSDFILVPIPLSGVKLLERTYNQAALITKDLSRRVGRRVEGEFLRRVKDTKSQTNLNLSERRANVKKAFVVPDEVQDKVTDANIILVDDVWTTGSTALEACRALKKAKAGMVWILTIARG